ncbi:YraN family protein [Acetobacteraceae bacterium]|nr:YraN family protein [Candidatus Parcubacteria bacterium]
MTPSPKRKIGDTGEEIACKFLQKKGYKIVERNYWKPWGEIDIVAQKPKSLVFVEVKSVSREIEVKGGSREITLREGNEEMRPEENMHPEKLKRLHRAIQTYLLERKISEDRMWQIDLVCVFLDFSTKKAKVELLENIS